MPEKEIFEINDNNDNIDETLKPSKPIKKEKRILTDEQKEELKERLKNGRINAKAKRDAKKKELLDEKAKLEPIKETPEINVIEEPAKKEIPVIKETPVKKTIEKNDEYFEMLVERKINKMIKKESAMKEKRDAEKKEAEEKLKKENEVKITHTKENPFNSENYKEPKKAYRAYRNFKW